MLWIAAVVAYLIGSVSFAHLIGRRHLTDSERAAPTSLKFAEGLELDYHGTSATSVRIKAGKRAGGIVAILDIAKGSVAVLIGQALSDNEWAGMIAGSAVIVGHVWPVFHRFVGGRGAAPFMGAMLIVDWTAIPFFFLVGAAIGLAIGDIVMTYGGGIILSIPWYAWRHGVGPEFWLAVAGCALLFGSALGELGTYIDFLRKDTRTYRQRVAKILEGFPSGDSMVPADLISPDE